VEKHMYSLRDAEAMDQINTYLLGKICKKKNTIYQLTLIRVKQKINTVNFLSLIIKIRCVRKTV
jgi:hypothetical protein